MCCLNPASTFSEYSQKVLVAILKSMLGLPGLPTFRPHPGLSMASEHEISVTREFAEEYQQIQKMEVVGRLASGVAHDFNNLLTVIIGSSELLLSKPCLDADGRDLVDDIRKAADQAAMLTRQLLAFSRRQPLEFVVLDVNDLVGNLGRMLQRLIGENIKLVTALDPTLHKVKADAGQLAQVIMNLAVNARDAMPRGGTLTLKTANASVLPVNGSTESDIRPGPYATLEISDNGCGMDKDTLARLFEPFFTTKQPGKGTGLGLAFAYGIIQQMGGHIHVTSQCNMGTTFKIFLPHSAESKPEPERNGHTTYTNGKETILLVEDEASLRKLTRQVLQSSGYTVLEASNGLEALVVAEQHEGAIDLVVTDVIMPWMSGPQMVSKLFRLRPSLKVLYVSGYTDSAIARQAIPEAQGTLLQKPFTPSALTLEIRKTLGN
jgi:two-component system cell cycle sensor histidine kinase/response regulator CckA